MYKIAFIATGYIVEYDGISVYIENVLKRLLKHSIVEKGDLAIDILVGKSACDFFTQRLLGKNNNDNINLIPISDSNAIVRIWGTQTKVLFKKYDFIFMPNPMPLFFSRGKRLKVIHDLTIKQTPDFFSKKMHLYIDFLIWYMYHFDDAIGYISQQTKRDILHFYKIDTQKTRMLHLPNGIPFKVQNYTQPKIEDVYKKYESRDISFVVVGRINRSKGFDRILKFLNHFENYLEKNDTFNHVTLHVVGKQTEETTAILQDSNFKHINLDFCGYVDDEKLNTLYRKSHFCFFLSRNEGYGLPLVESMWFYTIPILSDIPIFSEIMGSMYPKFSDESGYEEAIRFFIERIYDDIAYRHTILDMLQERIGVEKEGYQHCVENLVNYIKTV